MSLSNWSNSDVLFRLVATEAELDAYLHTESYATASICFDTEIQIHQNLGAAVINARQILAPLQQMDADEIDVGNICISYGVYFSLDDFVNT